MQILYTLIVAIFFGGIFFYLVNWVIVPWNSENIVDVKNLTIFSVLFIITFTCFFSFIHQIVDKLFFRKFYEKPRLVRSIRRGFLLGLMLISLAWLRIFGFFEWHIIALNILLMILFEILFRVMFKKSHQL